MSSPQPRSKLSVLLRLCATGDKAAENEVFEMAYNDLKRIARSLFRFEDNAQSFQPSVLVNEAFLRMPRAGEIEWSGRKHFFAIASRAMRRVLVDAARARATGKRFGSVELTALTADSLLELRDPLLVLMVDEALTRFAEIDPRAASVVEMKFFSDMTMEEIAGVKGIDARTVKRDWADGKTWLFDQLKSSRQPAHD